MKIDNLQEYVRLLLEVRRKQISDLTREMPLPALSSLAGATGQRVNSLVAILFGKKPRFERMDQKFSLSK